VTETEARPRRDAPLRAAVAPLPLRPSISVVGAGRAGAAMATALRGAGYTISVVCSRHRAHAEELARRLGAGVAPTPLAAARAADITILAVPDPAIVAIAASLAASGAALPGRGVVHLSANRGLEVLAALRSTAAAVGCLHPLQALAGKASASLLRGSLMAIEADARLVPAIGAMVDDLGGRAVILPAGARGLYHAAAVLAGNAPLALLAVASRLLVEAGVDPGDAEVGLASLMRGALANAARFGARAALTGPVARGDAATVALHLRALDGRPETQALYRSLARATVTLAGETGREDVAAVLDGPARPARGAA
jgi:predicted short-subunit dehydrogenase-like oxidoreductase (DUF2520 family)